MALFVEQTSSKWLFLIVGLIVYRSIQEWPECKPISTGFKSQH